MNEMSCIMKLEVFSVNLLLQSTPYFESSYKLHESTATYNPLLGTSNMTAINLF
jgi:hypothetical protein